ncbi:MAG: phosphoenolpyruvate hydrolase family protein [Firmicutes bacterium]|nr:phosphoenolpyruvate hydrolase family protein [Bacillota bacterium]
MAARYGRAEVLQRLRKTVEDGKPIIGAGAGFGLVAKCEDIGGVDFIVVYSSGKSRRLGLKTSLIGDANALVKDLGKEVLFVVKNAPVIAGIQATDPTRDIHELVDSLIDMGFSGIINYPSVGLYGREWLNGYEEEVEIEARIMRELKSRDILTMTYVYRPEEAKLFASAVDLVIAHVGWTAGGLVGNKNVLTLEEACDEVQSIIDIVKAENPDAICLAHGGPFVKPEDTECLYARTTAVGYVGASSIERIPIEEAVINCVRQFKGVSMKSK